MAAIRRSVLFVLAIFFLGESSASAFNSRLTYWYASPAVTTYYYAPTPVYAYYWAVPLTYYCPVPSAVRVVPVDPNYNYAQPVPAPPSPTSEPPLGTKPFMPPAKALSKSGPIIVATKAMTAPYVPGSTPLPKERCRVGFWNVSGRDVTLTIDGKSWTLPKNQAVTLDLERMFSWQVDQQPQQIERIQEGQATHELVIRE